MAQVHELHRAVALRAERPQEERRRDDDLLQGGGGRARGPDTMARHTHTSCFVAFPEQRNVHGKLFGGWVTGTAFDIAYYAARFFVRGRPARSEGPSWRRHSWPSRQMPPRGRGLGARPHQTHRRRRV